MFGRRKPAAPDAPKRCRCEASTPPAVLDGFACGRADCWRTAPVRASFDAFVTTLVASRDGAASVDGKGPHDG